MLKKMMLVVCALWLNIIPSIAQNLLTPEYLWKFARVSGPQVSPDGKKVLFGARNYNLTKNNSANTLYLISITGGSPIVVADSLINGSNATWHPSGKKIMYTTATAGAAQLWEMNPDGTGKRQVSDIPGGISGYGMSKQGDKIWYTQDVKILKTDAEMYPDLPKNSARIYDDLMYRHWDHWEDESFSHVFYAAYSATSVIKGGTDIMADEPFDSPLSPFGGSEQISWSPDGKKIAYTCKKYSGIEYAMSTNSDIYLFDIATGKTQNLTYGMVGYDKNPAFSPDGSKITWLSMETPMYEADRNRLFQLNMNTGNKTELTTGFDYTVEQYNWSMDGRSIYFICGINATDQMWVYDSLSKSGPQIKQLTTDNADITEFSLGTDGKNPVLVTGAMNISMPTELHTVDLKTGKSKQLSNINSDLLAGIKMGKVEKRMIKATDGKEILTWVIYPPNFDPNKKYPAILYCQGGPQSTVSQFFSYRWNFQLMAANGYVVVAPNRRGLPSFGTEWNRQISGDWGGQAMKDLLSAIDSVSNEPYVDKDKLGAVGASFGGYSVYWLAGNHQKRFKAFISHCGVFNTQSMYGTTEELFFADFDMGGSYMKVPKPRGFAGFNPLNYAIKWDTPILIIHNDMDFRVPISQGMEAFTAARLKKVPARFLSFPDENHWVLKPQNGIVWQREFFGWLDKYLK